MELEHISLKGNLEEEKIIYFLNPVYLTYWCFIMSHYSCSGDTTQFVV